MVPHSSFDVHFSNNWWCWASFHVFFDHPYVLFGDIGLFVFLMLSWRRCLYILESNPLSVASFANLFCCFFSPLKSLLKFLENYTQRLPSRDRCQRQSFLDMSASVLSVCHKIRSRQVLTSGSPSPVAESLVDASASRPGGWLMQILWVLRSHLAPCQVAI